jgi:primosomal protein N' (replication factor Y)
VEVPLGARRVVGLVLGDVIAGEAGHGSLKPIVSVLDDTPVVSDAQIALVRFVARYYAAPLGPCAWLALPPDTTRAFVKRYVVTEAGLAASVFGSAAGLSPRDVVALAQLPAAVVRTERELSKLGVTKARVQKLVARGLVEERDDAARVRAAPQTTFVVPVDGPALPSRSTSLLAVDAWLRARHHEGTPIALDDAQAAFANGRGKVHKLVALGRAMLEQRDREQHTRASGAGVAGAGTHALTDAQMHAVTSIERAIADAAATAFLLQGVTGSGKTEVYLRAVRACLARGQSALLLVPEIALTPQLLARVRAAVDVEVVVLHSNVSAVERRAALARLRGGEARVVVGARSSLFAPLPNLGLIVVDEEHDPSLKQDETPRYHARDVALWRAKHEGAVCVLGSATPSLESVHNVVTGKLVQLLLPVRLGGGGVLPRVELIDLRTRALVPAHKKADRKNADDGPGVVLSQPLLDAMRTTLNDGAQVVLFLNRRGYTTALLCEACGEVRKCPHCTVSLTYHRARHRLVCHQCDHEETPATTCLACGADTLVSLGLGTERLEAEVRSRFPTARIARLDRDSVRGAADLERILHAIHAREVDIVVGTQMIAKGHDFPGVHLVGVVLADLALSLPDFRASERTFSLLTQVAGRAGRGELPGRVLVQTYMPEHESLQRLVTHDVMGFDAVELELRRSGRYPPYARALLVRVEGDDEHAVGRIASDVAGVVRDAARAYAVGVVDVLGPAPCPLLKLKGKTRFQVFVRSSGVAERAHVVRVLQRDEQLIAELARAKARLVVDIDPVHML